MAQVKKHPTSTCLKIFLPSLQIQLVVADYANTEHIRYAKPTIKCQSYNTRQLYRLSDKNVRAGAPWCSISIIYIVFNFTLNLLATDSDYLY